jgi:tRNA modification GTPase
VTALISESPFGGKSVPGVVSTFDPRPSALAMRTSDLSAGTIAAISTAPGRAGVAVVRVSGPAAHDVVARVVSPWPTAERRATLCAVREPWSGALIDRALVTRFEAPRSYTGEPMVEIATHGGHLVPAATLGALVAAGAREALAGEFTRRAVLNGKLDLLQAEAVGDLVDARSRLAHRTALTQLDGGLSRRVLALRSALLDLEALIAYDIDFPEEDDGPVAGGRILGAADRALRRLDALLAGADAGELLREGALVVIAGAPNVGKSSLFNALLGAARAIVTPIPGTTRDALEAVIDAAGWPVRLVDTAGLRATDDVVERLGIEVSERYLAGAHLVLACGDGGGVLCDAVTRARRLSGAPVVAVRTKGDLVTPEAAAADLEGLAAAAAVAASAETGEGLDALVRAMATILARRHAPPDADAPLLTRVRHRAAVAAAREELAAFRRAWADGALPAPVAAVHLRTAVTALEELVGTVDVEDVLDRVFGTFCVGK